jgi:hypothetical protein
VFVTIEKSRNQSRYDIYFIHVIDGEVVETILFQFYLVFLGSVLLIIVPKPRIVDLLTFTVKNLLMLPIKFTSSYVIILASESLVDLSPANE